MTIVGRDAARGEAARATLAAEVPSAEVALMLGDANGAAGAEHIVSETLALRGRVDVLVVATVGAAAPTGTATPGNGFIYNPATGQVNVFKN